MTMRSFRRFDTRWILHAVCVVSLAACSSSHSAPAPDVSPSLAREFTPPEGKARVYVVRGGGTKAMFESFKVSVDARELGEVAHDTYLVTDVDPGRHLIDSWTKRSHQQEVLLAEAGRSYFFTVRPEMGMMGARVVLDRVSAKDGIPAVQKATRAPSAF